MADVMHHYRVKTVIRGMAHITGGGLVENVERILPANRRLVIDRKAWQPPAVFVWLQQLGDVDEEEMSRVFNMGIGYVLVVNPYYADSIQRQLATHRIESWVIGEIEEKV
jgi:phosphoribosylformylglycinamidine cyclo-ligase